MAERGAMDALTHFRNALRQTDPQKMHDWIDALEEMIVLIYEGNPAKASATRAERDISIKQLSERVPLGDEHERLLLKMRDAWIAFREYLDTVE